MKLWWVMVVGIGLVGCDEALYGTGTIYVWNGTLERNAIRLQGRSPMEAVLRPEIGALLEDAVAGPYRLERKDGAPLEVTLTRGHLVVFNLGGVGCFARTDVAGMYKSGREPVRVLEVYEGQELIDIVAKVSVMPGKRLPASAPRSSMTFERFAVIPCKLADDRNEVGSYVLRLR